MRRNKNQLTNYLGKLPVAECHGGNITVTTRRDNNYLLKVTTDMYSKRLQSFDYYVLYINYTSDHSIIKNEDIFPGGFLRQTHVIARNTLSIDTRRPGAYVTLRHNRANKKKPVAIFFHCLGGE
jgi:hypothetical protein